jgi:hypothetical protein
LNKRIDHGASFRDPAARVFFLENESGHVFRELSPSYLPNYTYFKSSGLADTLIQKKWLSPFEEIQNEGAVILKSAKISFVSLPYEWTFNEWKDAALLTLKIQYQALKYGMILKDATPFNVVFDGGKPVFVDLSSFEILQEGKPWKAFKQFCECFYIPLLLIKYFDNTGNDIFLNNINGIPVSKGLALLPSSALLNFNTLLFLSLPGKMRRHYEVIETKQSSKKITAKSLMQVAEQLYAAINKISQKKQQTRWNDYYDKNVNDNYLQEKAAVIKEWIGGNYKTKTLVDFGCNTGNFSKLVAVDVSTVIAFDEDMRSADELYSYCREHKLENVFSFTANICQPTPGLGWDNMERPSLKERLNADIGLALALVHHLAISNYIDFNKMAAFFSETCKEIFIEFIPKEDAKVQLLLSNREDIFNWYCRDNFLSAFNKKFRLVKEHCFTNNRSLFHFTHI